MQKLQREREREKERGKEKEEPPFNTLIFGKSYCQITGGSLNSLLHDSAGIQQEWAVGRRNGRAGMSVRGDQGLQAHEKSQKQPKGLNTTITQAHAPEGTRICCVQCGHDGRVGREGVINGQCKHARSDRELQITRA